MTIGQKIRKKRIEKKMKQKELGFAIGSSEVSAESLVRKYEIGRMNPKEDRMRQIADALETDVEYFFDSTFIESPKKIYYLLDELHDNGVDLFKLITEWATERTSLSKRGEDIDERGVE